ncbi:MAG: hypothetical protein L6R39_000253 [Caloplaca ligustica]|nr:MAG: hypothetical protein L6R39_000253 [Caloplaca ligustica]
MRRRHQARRLTGRSRGILNTFSVFQIYYASELMPHNTPSNISWIGSIQAFLLWIVGVATGPVYDAGYFRTLISLGTFLTVFGMMMTSISKAYWEVMLAQALCVGLGCGCLFIPSVAIVSTYFTTKKSFATGIAASGSSLGKTPALFSLKNIPLVNPLKNAGGIIYPIVFHHLLPRIGFGWATRVVALIMAATLCISLSVMKVRVKPAQKRELLQLSAFKELPYTLFTLGEFFGLMSIDIPFFYIQMYATEAPGTRINENLAVYLLVILNAASIFGRVIPNLLTDKTGPLNMLIPCTAICSLLAFCWTSIHSKTELILFCILYGFFSGTFNSLPPTTIVSLSPSLGVVGTRMGMSFAFAGLGRLVGTPVAGTILGSGTDFMGVQMFCGAILGTTAVAFLAARVAKVGLSFRAKA